MKVAYLEHDPEYLVDATGSVRGLLVIELDVTETLLPAGVFPPVLGIISLILDFSELFTGTDKN